MEMKDAFRLSFSNNCDQLQVILAHDALSEVWQKPVGASLSDLPCTVRYTFDPPESTVAIHKLTAGYMVAFLNTHFRIADQAGLLTPSYAAQSLPRVDVFGAETCTTPLSRPAYYAYQLRPGQCAAAAKDPAGFFLTDSVASAPLEGFQIQQGGYVVAGQWSGYAAPDAMTSSAADAGTTTIAPADFSSVADGAPGLCVQGTIGAASDSGAVASIRVNTNQARAAADAGASDAGLGAGLSPVQTVRIMGGGITVQYTNPGGSPLRLVIQTPENDSSHRYCALLSGIGGTETVTWDAFWGGSTKPWEGCGNATGNNPPAGLEISGVSVLAPGSTTSAVPYNFCLQGLAQAP
jgi:hypothetical protein